MNVDGSRRRAVTPMGFYEGPVWSPDGAQLAFVRYRRDNADVYVANADGSGKRRLAHAISYVPNPFGAGKGGHATPAWSPDGRKIAFMSNRDGSEEIYLVNLDGSGLVNPTRSRGRDNRPMWSPNGRLIAFRSDRDGNGEVYVMNADGSGVRRLTRNPASDGGPVWSPDGRKLLFVRFRHGNSDIYVMNRDGSGQRNLTPEARPARIARDGSPAWSPDGRFIAFLSERDSTGRIYVMTADGREQGALGTFVDDFYAVGRISRAAGNVRFSLSVPRARPQWENAGVSECSLRRIARPVASAARRQLARREHLRFGALPNSQQRTRKTPGLNAVWRVEMVAVGESLECEVGEDRCQSLGHATEKDGVAAATEGEVDRTVEGSKRFEVEVTAVERVDQCSCTCGPLRHPRRRWARGSGRRLDTGRELKSDKPGHELIGGQAFERPEALRQPILLGRPFISGPCGLEEAEAQEPLVVHSGEGERRGTPARVADEMETVEAVGVGGSQNPVHLVYEAKARRWAIPRVHLEILGERIDLLAEHLE